METHDPIEFRVHPVFRWFPVCCAAVFLVLAVWSASASLMNAGGSFRYPIGTAFLFGGFWAVLLTLCVVWGIAARRGRLRMTSGGIEMIGLVSRRHEVWEDVPRLTMERSDELSYAKLTVGRRMLEGWTFDNAACARDDVQRVETFISSLPPETRPALEVIDIPDLKRRVVGYIVTGALAPFLAELIARLGAGWFD